MIIDSLFLTLHKGEVFKYNKIKDTVFKLCPHMCVKEINYLTFLGTLFGSITVVV